MGTRFHEALAVLPDRRAWLVEPDQDGKHRETMVPARLWVP
ncbi:hypothetical protein [Nonomuraea salmonea]